MKQLEFPTQEVDNNTELAIEVLQAYFDVYFPTSYNITESLMPLELKEFLNETANNKI